jgi:transcription antitermination factor NusG
LKTTFQENHLNPELPRWFAVRVGFRKEKYVNSSLLKLGIESYLPIREGVRNYRRKVKKVILPLFPMYVFVRIVEADYVKILQLNYVLGFVKIGNNLLSIPNHEIDTIKKVLSSGYTFENSSEFLKKGIRVEFKGGNLMGLAGVIIDDKLGKFVRIELETLGVGLIIEVAKENLIPISSRA